MKIIFFTALLFAATFSSEAQSQADKLYAYQQRIIPGTKKASTIDANGHFTKDQEPNVFQNLIYLSTFSKEKIHPILIWINGEAFSVKTERIHKTPVMQYNPALPKSKGNILVPETVGSVFHLIPVSEITGKETAIDKTLILNNAVVLYYKKGGKRHYEVLKKFTALSAVSLQ